MADNGKAHWAESRAKYLGVHRYSSEASVLCKGSVRVLDPERYCSVSETVEAMNRDDKSGGFEFREDCYIVWSRAVDDYVLLYRSVKDSIAEHMYSKILTSLSRAGRRAVQIMRPSAQHGERKLQVAHAGITELTHQLQEVGKQESVKKVAVVSIMGQMRQGKSFLLNCLCRYFEWLESEQKKRGNAWKPRARDQHFKFTDDEDSADTTPEPWLEDLEGHVSSSARRITAHFDVLRGDEKACTEGIWCLSKPFVLFNPNSKDKFLVLVMDSQGAFDPRKDMKVSTSILAVTAVLASSLICNTMHFDSGSVRNFDELNNLIEHQVAVRTEAAQENSRPHVPFGSLVFLLRDKQFAFECDGGQPMSFDACATQVTDYTEVMLDETKISPENESLRPVARRLQKNFNGVRSWGLLCPGKRVVRNASLDSKDLGTYFKRMLGEFFRSEFEDALADFPRASAHCFSGEELTVRNFSESIVCVCGAFADCDPRVGVPELAAGIIARKAIENFKLQVRTDIKPCSWARFPKERLHRAKAENIKWFDDILQERFAELVARSASLLDREKMENIIRREEDMFNVDKLRAAEDLTRWGCCGACGGVVCFSTGLYKTVWTSIIVPAPWTLPVAATCCVCGAYGNHSRQQRRIKQYRVVKVAGENVFSDMHLKDALCTKPIGETLWGRQQGDWVELVEEPGRFMLVRNSEGNFLEMVKDGLRPWDVRLCGSFAHVTYKKIYWYVQVTGVAVRNFSHFGSSLLRTSRASGSA
mmetsp:Transcript_57717/g.153866  ORF Transcript_57717/g.153866 Transcript_57717/m.153866 type:complete len:759 (-) Transcript_57717:249-2525(-)